MFGEIAPKIKNSFLPGYPINTPSIFPFGTSKTALDPNADTGMTLISNNPNTVSQFAVANSTKNNFIMLWSGRSSDVNPLVAWSSGTILRFATCTAGALTTGGYSLLYTMDSTGIFSAGGGLTATAGNITATNGNFVIGTNGKVIQYPHADADKLQFYGTATEGKIDTSAGWNLNFRSGSNGSASTGIFNFYATNAANAWVNNMSLANNGDLSLLTGGLILSTTGKKIQLATGVNAARGSVTLSGSSTTVNTSAATTGCAILLPVSAVGGTQGLLSYTISNGVSFTITSSTTTLDTSTIQWVILT